MQVTSPEGGTCQMTSSGEEDTSRDYGVYDLKFLPYHPIFAAATTLGKILICQLEEIGEPEQKDLQIKEVSSHQVIPENITICSVAWFPLQHASDGTRILAFTVEDGRVFLVRFRDDFKSFDFLNGQLPVHQHFDKTPVSNNAERAWCCAFSRPRPDSVMSGGDDSVLRRSTLNFPQDLTTLQEDSSLWSVVTDLALYREKRFPQGVTAILPFPFCTPECSSTIFLVGCYDSSVGLWSVYGKDVPEAEVNLGGGVYRLKFLQYEPGPPEQVACTFQVLASCMDAGTKILEVKRSISGHWFIDVVAEVKDHQDLCYAADVQPLPAPGDGEAPITCLEERICVSSSFKDCKLSVWKFNPLHVVRGGIILPLHSPMAE
ncbi:uncharacterized protein LY89DRAFT_123913 [Mollisia scopiformis]|uniref:Uncharacterized protein n=1 Tax=Mollisia scopiformis TaxID=149040 RepID=A0A194X469_MOLSC|nr:uncharacterized protein LY89DRAFT_123913 [Mollisia scopiformis]KUJ14854.1 hypothetical protein LY89DRAFT_123913 [Mollisia scopiformis]